MRYMNPYVMYNAVGSLALPELLLCNNINCSHFYCKTGLMRRILILIEMLAAGKS